MNLAIRRLSFENIRKLHSHIEKPVREISIPVPWGKIAGKWWGSIDVKPILSVHGLQDSCGSFDRLIPVLNKDISFLAIDLPGHGFSTHFPRGMTYEVTTHALLLKRIMDYFKWPKVSLLGHSVGAMICYSFANVYQENVDYLICIDAFKCVREPVPRDWIRAWFDRFLKFEKAAEEGIEPPSYTLEELNKKVSEEYHNSIELKNAHYIFSRNISPSKIHPGKYYFSRDPVLKSPIVFICPQSQEEIIEDAKSFSLPIFICKTAKHTYMEDEEKFYEVLEVVRKASRDCEFHKVGGTHHVHLNEPDKVGKLVNNFLEKHYKFEKSNVSDDSSIFSNLNINSDILYQAREDAALHA
ncbi:hypothetical protein HHI36_008648 [Cryptolaemus montrouzieri]|uniref:AB hydrolase-1 domain-containing protein n=1 Tax=Cryptolaemus montrouzieri TaxID=559131 RepID=A0ABD2MTT1_9CUCU